MWLGFSPADYILSEAIFSLSQSQRGDKNQLHTTENIDE
jgi:hypothetical protein